MRSEFLDFLASFVWFKGFWNWHTSDNSRKLYITPFCHAMYSLRFSSRHYVLCHFDFFFLVLFRSGADFVFVFHLHWLINWSDGSDMVELKLLVFAFDACNETRWTAFVTVFNIFFSFPLCSLYLYIIYSDFCIRLWMQCSLNAD